MKSERGSDSEAGLFREAMSGVRPLRGPNRSEQKAPAPPAIPRQRELDERRVLEELLLPAADFSTLETGDELLFLRDGHPAKTLRRLRQGQFSVGDSIDLHAMNEPTARRVLLQFLEDSRQRGLGCVRVVHGKGLRSRGLPKLKRMTAHVLRRHPAVVAFASCRPCDGGTGAALVLLAHARRRRP